LAFKGLDLSPLTFFPPTAFYMDVEREIVLVLGFDSSISWARGKISLEELQIYLPSPLMYISTKMMFLYKNHCRNF